MHSTVLTIALASLACVATAAPPSDISLFSRAPQAPAPAKGTSTKVSTTPETSDPHDAFDPKVIIGGMVQCLAAIAPSKNDQLIAELSICGGIKAPINNCPGTEQKSTGTSGKALWTLEAAAGEKINIFKGRWEECCNAGRATCKGKAFSLQCENGTNAGNPVTITLSSV